MDNNALKTISKTDTELRVSNYMILFGGKDLTKEYFTPQTDFESDYTKAGVLYVDWEHGLDPDKMGVNKDAILGTVDWKTARVDEKGLFVERVLNRRNKYMQYLEELIDAGLIGNSTEAVEKEKTKDGEIKVWRLKRDSLTVIPAEPRMMTENVISAIKSLGLELPALADNQPDEKAQDGQGKPEAQKTKGAHISLENLGEQKMSDTNVTQTPAPEYKALEEKLNAVSAQMDALMKHIEDAPAIKNSGYVSQDGGRADENVKSFGDFLKAIHRGDNERLMKVYGSVKAMNEDSGAAGGYIVPTEYNQRLLTVAYQASPILGLVQRVPVNANSGTYPALDITTAPSAGTGNTALAGKVTSAKRAESGAYTETTPSFQEIKWRINDAASGYTKASKELVADSPAAIEALLTSLFGIAVAAKQEYFILRGNGVGEPLGILNADAKVGITPDTNNVFSYADAVEMVSRFKKLTANARWVMHQSTLPDFAGSGWVQGQVVRTINDLGFGEAIMSEHLPQADNSGHVLLADFGAYLLFEKGGLEIAYSQHADFLNGNDVWRFSQRMDGQPWLKSPITQADPQGSFTVSPFVYFND